MCAQENILRGREKHISLTGRRRNNPFFGAGQKYNDSVRAVVADKKKRAESV